MGSHFLLQGIFLTQGLNLGSLAGGSFTAEPPGKPAPGTVLCMSDYALLWPWDFFGRNDTKAETPVLWPPHAKS